MKLGIDMKLGIAADHARFGLKEELIVRVRADSHDVTDLGRTGYGSADLGPSSLFNKVFS